MIRVKLELVNPALTLSTSIEYLHLFDLKNSNTEPVSKSYCRTEINGFKCLLSNIKEMKNSSSHKELKWCVTASRAVTDGMMLCHCFEPLYCARGQTNTTTLCNYSSSCIYLNQWKTPYGEVVQWNTVVTCRWGYLGMLCETVINIASTLLLKVKNVNLFSALVSV